MTTPKHRAVEAPVRHTGFVPQPGPAKVLPNDPDPEPADAARPGAGGKKGKADRKPEPDPRVPDADR